MSSTIRIQQRYDHRLRDLVRSSGNIDLATQLGVPRSTAHGWLTSSQGEVVTVDVFDMDIPSLQKEILVLRRRLNWIVALFRLVVVSMKVSGLSLGNARLPDGSRKTRLIRTIESSLSVLPLRVALRLLKLSPSRYHAWKKGDECGLDDMSSCPRTSPQQLTRSEVTGTDHDILDFRVRERVTLGGAGANIRIRFLHLRRTSRSLLMGRGPREYFRI